MLEAVGGIATAAATDRETAQAATAEQRVQISVLTRFDPVGPAAVAATNTGVISSRWSPAARSGFRSASVVPRIEGSCKYRLYHVKVDDVTFCGNAAFARPLNVHAHLVTRSDRSAGSSH